MDEQLFQQKLRSTLLPAWEQLPDFGLYIRGEMLRRGGRGGTEIDDPRYDE